MRFLEGFTVVLWVNLTFVLSGYWLAIRVKTSTGERLALAMLGGVASLLFCIATVNAFLPLWGIGSVLCLLPVLATLCGRASRQALLEDLKTLASRRENLGYLGVGLVFIGLLLVPFLLNPRLVIFDAGDNHDNYFWASFADHLTRAPYLKNQPLDWEHPWLNPVNCILGWSPDWGRIGAEGMLALFSSLMGQRPVECYHFIVMAVYGPWVAAVYLVLRTFLQSKPGRWTLLAAFAFQPIYIFFQANSNIPNLFGTLMGTGLVVSVQRLLKIGTSDGPSAWGWSLSAILFCHGMLAAYPETAPFMLIPCALLGFLHWKRVGWKAGQKAFVTLSLVILLGTWISPMTGIRATRGFVNSFRAGQANHQWGDRYVFEKITPKTFPLALTSLSFRACEEMKPLTGALLSTGLVGIFLLGLARSEDPWSIAALFSGSALLLAYSIHSGFGYGYQKTVQNAGVFYAAFFPAGCLVWITQKSRYSFYSKLLPLLFAFMVLLYGHLTYRCFVRGWVHSGRKFLNRNALILEKPENQPPRAVVLGETFGRNGFFCEMWVAYLMPQTVLYYSSRSESPGGYLVEKVLLEEDLPGSLPAPYIISKEWADSWDFNSPRRLTTDQMVVVEKSNRILSASGLVPSNALPRETEGKAEFTVLPHQDSRLLLTLTPKENPPQPATTLTIEVETDHQSIQTFTSTSAPPWKMEIPLQGSVPNRIRIQASNGVSPSFPALLIQSAKIVNRGEAY